ncbi:hypothetical protein L3X38_012176 [Prunus dulcis]|uniref:Uncharacterized protein n=1 Tax=Prunus dulcis TaxID=3755 RepID=A0AAD4WKG1_PRUDU|nr:hypothetical protein L3X38_012176 [Prunus dulcis]
MSEPSYRMESFAANMNEEVLALNLDLIDEHRAQTNIRNEAYKQRVSRYYDLRNDGSVRPTAEAFSPEFDSPCRPLSVLEQRLFEPRSLFSVAAAVAVFSSWLPARGTSSKPQITS